jgi:hypothetical protein
MFYVWYILNKTISETTQWVGSDIKLRELVQCALLIWVTLNISWIMDRPVYVTFPCNPCLVLDAWCVLLEVNRSFFNSLHTHIDPLKHTQQRWLLLKGEFSYMSLVKFLSLICCGFMIGKYNISSELNSNLSEHVQLAK